MPCTWGQSCSGPRRRLRVANPTVRILRNLGVRPLSFPIERDITDSFYFCR